MEETKGTANRGPEQSTPQENASQEENYYGNTPRMRGDGDPGTTGGIPTRRPTGNTTGSIPVRRPTAGFGNTGSIPTQHSTGNTTGSIPTRRPSAGFGNTGSIRTQHAAGTTGSIPAQRAAGTTGSIRTQHAAGTTGSIRTQHAAGTTGSIPKRRPMGYTTEPSPDETGSLKINRRRAEEEENLPEEQLFENGAGSDENEKATGLGAVLASVPPKKLAVGGVIIAAILIAVILLVVLIPGGSKTTVVAATPTPVATETPTPAPANTPEPIVATTAHPCATPLERGMSAPVVAEIQERLYELGYMEMPVVDGVEQFTTSYGSTTRSAIKSFQSKNGLQNDGICGQSTYDLLMSDQAKAFTLSRGDTDDLTNGMVTKLQNRLVQLGFLKLSKDDTAKYGTKTVEAVKAFQTANGLQVDGQAGAKTLEVLYSDSAIDANGKATAMTSTTDTATTTASAGTVDVEVDTVDVVVEDDGEVYVMDDSEIEIDPDAVG